MTVAATAPVKRCGTDEVSQNAQHITAGPLSVTLQNGNLRCVAIGGREAIRGIAFVVRDKDWGTYIPTIDNLEVDVSDREFCIRYDAVCGDADQVLEYRANITGAADGSLEFVVEGQAQSPFLTSRTGFVVLHPVDGVAGASVVVTHTDGAEEHARFPDLISPSQPFMDIRSLRHDVAPGLAVTCTMEGDAFEMEDQRNWTDASYKTYIRPLAKPHPFTLEPDETLRQRVVLRTDGKLPELRVAMTDKPAAVVLGNGAPGRVPAFALAVDPAYAQESLQAASHVRRSGIGKLFCTFDASAGHDAATMAAFRELAERTQTALVLEAVLPLRDADGEYTDDIAVLDADIAAIRSAANAAGVSFTMVSASPAAYLKSYQPQGPWPLVPPLELVYSKIGRVFPGASIGAGMHSYFTEFNRRPPPADMADFVTHSTSPIVHAGDDTSVMETLQSLPFVFASARKLGGGKPYWIGPTAIGMRFNPYGSTTMPNPDNVRGAMMKIDPRQRGLFNAAWTLGYIARAAAGGVDGLCLSAVAGPSGVAWQQLGWSQPWFDEVASNDAVFPVYHVLAGLAANSGASLRAVQSSDAASVAAIAFDTEAGEELWLANLSATSRAVTLVGVRGNRTLQCLDESSFERCCLDRDGFATTAVPLDGDVVDLGPYAVARIS